MFRFTILLSALLIFFLTGCRQSVDGTPVGTQQPNNPSSDTNGLATTTPTYNLILSTDPATLNVGEALLIFDITAPDGSPVSANNIQLLRAQGDMTHAGMVPVIEEGRARGFATDQNGRYAMPFNFNMGGDWIITGTATLQDGTVITGRLNTSVR